MNGILFWSLHLRRWNEQSHFYILDTLCCYRTHMYPPSTISSSTCTYVTAKTLAKRTPKLTQVVASFRFAFNLRFVWPTATRDDVRWFGRAQIWGKSTQVFTVRPPNTSRHKFSDHRLSVYVWIYITTFYNLHELPSRFANPFGHPSKVRTQVLVLQVNYLRWLASTFGQGLTPVFPFRMI